MKYIKGYLLLGLTLILGSCSDFLDRDPDQILTNDQIFSDAKMINSVLAGFYGDTENWGQSFATPASFTKVDDGCVTDGGRDNMQEYSDNQWRVYPYKYIRNLNQFLAGLRATTVLESTEKLRYEGEIRFLRAWAYFSMCRGLGGVPLVNDNVYEYEAGMDVSGLAVPRSKESEVYDYIINECATIADYLPTKPTTNAARATRWAALMLKARAAVYAGSLANYNNKMVAPIRTEGNEVGIPAEMATPYYETALEAAKEVITQASAYYNLDITVPNDLGQNFYNAVCVKENNHEVIWAKDYAYPGATHGFTQKNIPASLAEDQERCYSGAVLNLVEAFEYKDNRDGTIKVKDESGNYIMYSRPEDAFANKDARLWGTVLYPGAKFRGSEVVLQAGQKVPDGNGNWKEIIGKADSYDDNNRLITSINGPMESNEIRINKTGFFFRKFLDETIGASTNSKMSTMWYPRFRISEAYMIACEAAYELNKTGEDDPLNYINPVRARAGISELESITFEDIVREYRVEFALEDHRYWDLKRWRLAHEIWDGNSEKPDAQLYELFPYQVNDPGSANDKMWVFDKKKAYMVPYPRYFQMKNYYNFFDNSWLNKNPLLVKNPYQ